MSTDNFHNFLNAISQDASLQSRLREILASAKTENGRSVAEKVAALSVEAGTPFTAGEFLASHLPEDAEEIAEEELKSVAAGYDTSGITLGGIICNWR